MRRINEIFDARPAVRDSPPRPGAAPSVGEIEFRNVAFSFPGTRRKVLRDLSFRVEAGEMIGVVGATGSGKSALVSLLARLYDPDFGVILLDGIPLREIPIDSLRAAIGMVPQDAFLFSDTIRENLMIGVEPGPNAEERIRSAAAVAQFDTTVLDLPRQYDTVLGERGINLSGGQKQRATLARAIARDPRVLILDDALSAVDTHTEAEILRGLRTVLRERTSIVVSHRVTAVMHADFIIVLEDGQIVERGTHQELIRGAGAYATLLRRQILEQEVGGETVLARPSDVP